jgi:hypothetical protein
MSTTTYDSASIVHASLISNKTTMPVDGQHNFSFNEKMSSSICYHVVRNFAAMRESIICHVPSVDNPADIYTKVVSIGQKRQNLIILLLHDLCD